MDRNLFVQMWEWVEWKDVGHSTHLVMYNKNGEFEIDMLVPKKWYDKLFRIGERRIEQAIDKMLKRGKFKITL